MKSEHKYPEWLLWFLERGLAIALIVCVLLVVLTAVFAWHMDQRLDTIEENMVFSPPSSFTDPDLSEFAADVSADSLPVKRDVYVPTYSHVYFNGGRPYLLECTLSIRNTDLQQPAYIRSVKYYGNSGELLKTHVDQLVKLDPLETIEFVVQARDTTGGSGANFIVQWMADESVNEPYIEAVLVGSSGTQGISFRCEGRSFPAD